MLICCFVTSVDWPNVPKMCYCQNIQIGLQKQNCFSYHDNHAFIWYTTLVEIKYTIEIFVEHYGLFVNYFQCKCVFFKLNLYFWQLIDLEPQGHDPVRKNMLLITLLMWKVLGRIISKNPLWVLQCKVGPNIPVWLPEYARVFHLGPKQEVFNAILQP